MHCFRASIAAAIKAWKYWEAGGFNFTCRALRRALGCALIDIFSGCLWSLRRQRVRLVLCEFCCYLLIVQRVELLLIIVCACVPTLKPLYDRYFRKTRTEKRNLDLFLSNQPISHPIQSDSHAANDPQDRFIVPANSRETALRITSKNSQSHTNAYSHV